ncbi:MAG: hypothetical protein AAAB35_01170 [Phyllobacterium sp.]|uniref:hypothetical protein n=1 Tax=Phyllobacterium sp. TaxID=1871046 RepID=UPI0030F1F4BE
MIDVQYKEHQGERIALAEDEAGNVYVNVLGKEGTGSVWRADGRNDARLVAIGARYNPDRFPCVNRNAKPTSTVR